MSNNKSYLKEENIKENLFHIFHHTKKKCFYQSMIFCRQHILVQTLNFYFENFFLFLPFTGFLLKGGVTSQWMCILCKYPSCQNRLALRVYWISCEKAVLLEQSKVMKPEPTSSDNLITNPYISFNTVVFPPLGQKPPPPSRLD